MGNGCCNGTASEVQALDQGKTDVSCSLVALDYGDFDNVIVVAFPAAVLVKINIGLAGLCDDGAWKKLNHLHVVG